MFVTNLPILPKGSSRILVNRHDSGYIGSTSEPCMPAPSILKVILPAGKVPAGSTVTKRTGTKAYHLADRLVLRGDDRKEVRAQPGCLFLLAEASAEVEATPDTLEVVWLAPDYALLDYLDPSEDV